jgi:hypothetical protein
MSKDLELTQHGVRLSYLRFLSDSAPGFVLLLVFASVYSLRLPVPFFGTSWLSVYSTQVSNQVRIFILILLFLLATPVGLALNALGWFVLGPLPIWLLKLWQHLPRVASFPLISTRLSLHANQVIDFFDLKDTGNTANQLYSQANFYEALLVIYFPTYYELTEHKRGLRRFIRSLAVIALLVSIYCFLTLGQMKLGLVFGITFILLVLFLSLLEYDQAMDILFRVFVLSSNLHGEPTDRQQIVSNLIEVREKKVAQD